jgi:hypothetical protein
MQLAEWSRTHIAGLDAAIDRFGRESVDEPQRVRSALFHGVRVGGLGLLRDLQDLVLLVKQVDINWTSTLQGAKALHDVDLEALCTRSRTETHKQLAWLETQIKQGAPQALIVNPDKGATLRASVPKSVTPSVIPELFWSPLAAGSLVAMVGVVAWGAGQPWLIPSLGPTAYLQAETPAHPSSRFYNTLVGHLIGLMMGFVAVAVCAASTLPSPLLDHVLTLPRVWASALALLLTLLAALLLKTSHPPTGATTLLVALGAIRTTEDAINAAIGVFLIASLGEVLRRIRLKGAVVRSE